MAPPRMRSRSVAHRDARIFPCTCSSRSGLARRRDRGEGLAAATALRPRRLLRAGASRRHTVALVNVDFGPAMLLGSGLMASGVALYQVRVVRPQVSRDYDIMFASIALLCGGILIFQGWRLDPLLLFGQILTSSAAITFAVEAVKLRGEVDALGEPADASRGGSLPRSSEDDARFGFDDRGYRADPGRFGDDPYAYGGDPAGRVQDAVGPSQGGYGYDGGDGDGAYIDFDAAEGYGGDGGRFGDSPFGEGDADVYENVSDWD